jgi:hypothetical protein
VGVDPGTSYLRKAQRGGPRRDIVAQDGQKLTLGDTTVTLVFTPAHTESTFSLFFQVKDNGKPPVDPSSPATLDRMGEDAGGVMTWSPPARLDQRE